MILLLLLGSFPILFAKESGLETKGTCTRTATLDVTGNSYSLLSSTPFALCPVHDPSINREPTTGELFLFSTDSGGAPQPPLLHIRSSKDNGTTWFENGFIFSEIPSWAKEMIPEANNIWAPDISLVGSEWRVYYAISSFGSETSVIGLVTTPSLSSPVWTDRGLVLKSTNNDGFNAIDPNLFEGVNATTGELEMWLLYGSFWNGIFMSRVDPSTGMLLNTSSDPVHLAQRPPPDALEGSFMVQRGAYHYLFASFDKCCDGINSTYNVRYGRSSTGAQGPFIDQQGVSMLNGGGTRLFGGGFGWAASGGQSLLRDTVNAHSDTSQIVLHGYDGETGSPFLNFVSFKWTSDGWPLLIKPLLIKDFKDPVDSCNSGFDVTNFGAKGDGLSLDSSAIQSAIIAAAACPQGALVILPKLSPPSSSVYLSGPLFLESNVNLFIDKDVTLKASTNLSLWFSAPKPSAWQPPTVGFVNGGRCSDPTLSTNCTSWHRLNNVTLSGSGTIDGSGDAWWSMSTWWPNTPLPRPYLLELALIDGLHITGLTLARSAHWTIVPILSTNVLIERIFLDAGVDRTTFPYDGYNIDGLDSNNVVNMTLRDSVLHAGDDCIAINSRGLDAATGDFPSQNITIGPNVTCITPITIGSGTGMGIYDVVIKDSVVNASWGVASPSWRPRWYKTALRFKTARGRGPAGVRNVLVSNITAISIDLFVDGQPYYSCQNSSGLENWAFCVENAQPPPQPPDHAPSYVNVTFSLLRGDAWRFAWLNGLPEHPYSGWRFDDVDVNVEQEEWVCGNVNGSAGFDVNPPPGNCFG